MPDCHHMRQGDVFECPKCGLRIEVVAECDEVGREECTHPDHDDRTCTFRCCNEDLRPVR